MKYLYSVLFIIILCSISFVSGYFYHKPQTIVKEIEVVKNVDHIVYRDYSKSDCCEIAKNYDLTKFNQTFTVKELKPEYTELSLKWDLYERNGEQEIKVPVYQAGNFRFYVVGGIAAAAGGYGGYKLYKLLH